MCYKIAVASRKLVVERIKKITGENPPLSKGMKMPEMPYFPTFLAHKMCRFWPGTLG